METATTCSLVPALWTFPRPVSRIIEPFFPRQSHQARTHPGKITTFTGNPGKPRGTYNTSSKMVFPAPNSAGRIVNIYV